MAAPADLPKPNYWPAVSAVVAGDFSGACTQKGKTQSAAGPFTIAADGTVVAPGLKATLQEVEALRLLRMNFDGAEANVMSASGRGWDISLNSSEAASGSTAAVKLGKKIVSCQTSKLPAHLAGNKPHALVAAALASAPATVACKASKGRGAKQMAFKFATGMLTLGTHTIELAKVQQENVLFEKGYSQFTYYAVMDDESTFEVKFDSSGKLAYFETVDKDHKQIPCVVN